MESSKNKESYNDEESEFKSDINSQSKNDNVSESKNNQDEEDKQYIDEEGNLLDPNDLSYNSQKDQNPVIIFDSELLFLPKIEQVEIAIVLDTTGSMNPYLKGVKRFIRKLMSDAKRTISHYENDNLDVLRVGLVGYKDHDQGMKEGSYVSAVLCDLNENYNIFRSALYNVTASGGKDGCEAIFDGLNEAVNNLSWREDSMKYIYHICDYPPHGSIYKKEDENNKNNEIKNFDLNEDGCPCDLQIKDILKVMRGKYIEYTVVMLDNRLEKMIEEFSRYIRVDVMSPTIEKEEGVSGSQE